MRLYKPVQLIAFGLLLIPFASVPAFAQDRDPGFAKALDSAWRSLQVPDDQAKEALGKVLASLPGWDRDSLGPADRLEFDAFQAWAEAEHEARVHPILAIPPVLPTPLHDPVRFDLMNYQPLSRPSDVEAWIRRLALVPNQLREGVHALRVAQGSDRPFPRFILVQMAGSLESYLHTPPAFGEIAGYFRDFVVDEADRKRVVTLLEDQVYPQFRWAKAQIEDLVSRAPGGYTLCDPVSYRALVRLFLGESVDPQVPHDQALAELKALDIEIDALVPPGPGTPPERLWAFLKAEPLLSSEDLDWARQTGEELRTLTARWVSSPVPDFEVRYDTSDPVSNYIRPSEDGLQPAHLNLQRGSMVKGASALSLLAHEGVPGHALQLGLQLADTDAPRFRRLAWPPSFTEGWAFYSEGLLFDSPLGNSTSYRAFELDSRYAAAASVVLDTGLNALGWTYQQALAFLRKTLPGGNSVGYELAINRCLYWPAQGLSYDFGRAQLVALCDAVERALVTSFPRTPRPRPGCGRPGGPSGRSSPKI
jgi:uncharacterized protein (DUF885 family)